MAHEEIQEMLASHALSALDVADRRVVEEHLTTCLSCRGELEVWRSTAAALTFAGSDAEPSLGVRERILAQIETERRHLKEPAGTTGTEPAKVIPFSATAPRNIWASAGSLGAIAAAVAVLALLISVMALWRENRARQNEIARLTSEIKASQQRLEREREIIALLTQPGARMAELAGTNVARDAHAMIAYDKTGRAMLLASGLPAAPTGKAYQLWFIVGNQKLPGRMFTTDSTGNGDLRDQIPAAALGGGVFAVTLEPAGGVKSPTGDIFLLSGS
jgi:anti-sigma-K factor RskA